jgi:hypothetical protein
VALTSAIEDHPVYRSRRPSSVRVRTGPRNSPEVLGLAARVLVPRPPAVGRSQPISQEVIVRSGRLSSDRPSWPRPRGIQQEPGRLKPGTRLCAGEKEPQALCPGTLITGANRHRIQRPRGRTSLCQHVMLWGQGHDTRGMRGFLRAPLAAVAVVVLLALATGILQGYTSLARKAPDLNLLRQPAVSALRPGASAAGARASNHAAGARGGRIGSTNAERHRHMNTSRR